MTGYISVCNFKNFSLLSGWYEKNQVSSLVTTILGKLKSCVDILNKRIAIYNVYMRLLTTSFIHRDIEGKSGLPVSHLILSMETYM